MLRIPGILRRSVGGRLRGGTHGKLVHIGFTQNHRPSLLQIFHRFRRIGWYKIMQYFRRTGGKQPFRAEIVFQRNRHAGQRAGKLARLDALLHLFCLRQRAFPVDSYITIVIFICLLNLRKHRLCGLHRSGFSRPDRRGKLYRSHFCYFHILYSLCHTVIRMSAAP